MTDEEEHDRAIEELGKLAYEDVPTDFYRAIWNAGVAHERKRIQERLAQLEVSVSVTNFGDVQIFDSKDGEQRDD